MVGEFTFNNIQSGFFKLVCKSVKRPLLPVAKVRRIELPNSSGAYDFDGIEYGLRSVTMKIQYIGTTFEELRTRARSIASWLSTPGWAKLIINDEPDKYYLAKVTDEIELETLFEMGSADIQFDCQPFAYSTVEKTYNLSGNTSFNNPGTRDINCRSPYGSKFKITTSGSCTITMNGKSLTYSGGDSAIIDNVEMEVTAGGVNKFNSLTGDIDSFLSILPGDNVISISGGSIIINFIPMWM